jgi:hypothetical protein
MTFIIISATVLIGDKVETRNWLQRFRDWACDRQPLPMYDVKYASFKTEHGDQLPINSIFMLTNGTKWVVVSNKNFGAWRGVQAKPLQPMPKSDIIFADNYKDCDAYVFANSIPATHPKFVPYK